MRAIFQTLPGLIDELPESETRKAIIFAIWPKVLGEQLRMRSSPLSFENGTLAVAVADPEWKREFREHAPEIVFKLNRAFGRSMVERIVPVVDKKAVERSKTKGNIELKTTAGLFSVSPELRKVSGTIADAALRSHFLEAAAACIELRDSK